MIKGLPKNWVEASLKDISSFIDYRGKTPIKTDSGIPLITAKNVKKGFISRLPREFIHGEAYDDWMTRGIPQIGDVLITTEAPLGNVALVDIKEKFALAQRVITIQVNAKLSSPFLKYYLQSEKAQNDLVLNSTGTTVSGIKSSKLKELSIPLAPLPEQKRIVAKLDQLFASLEEVKTRMEKIPELLKQFRQSVLTQAVTGKLTEEWREGKELEEWRKVKIGEIADSIVPGRDKPKSFTGDIPWITTPDLKETYISGSNANYFLTENEIKEVRAKVIPVNSVVISIVGRFGIACIIKEECVINQQLHAYLPSSMIIPEYLTYSVKCLEDYMNSISSATTIAYINKTKANSLPINLPPLQEQTEIVSRVEALFSKADRIQEKYLQLKQQIDHLPQTILAKAFRGELVEQLPTDGDARELLKEIAKLKVGAKKKK